MAEKKRTEPDRRPRTKIRFYTETVFGKIPTIYKREHKIDVTTQLKGEDITERGWTAKEQTIQEDFIWGVRPEALYEKPEQNTIRNRTV